MMTPFWQSAFLPYLLYSSMLPITGDAEMPQLVVSSSAKSLTGISDYFFRMAVQDAAVGPQIANQFTKMGRPKQLPFTATTITALV